MLTIAGSTIEIPHVRSGRDILLRSRGSTSGAMLGIILVSSCAAAARNPSISVIARHDTERFAKASINESWRGLPIPSKINVPLLRSAERLAFSWASQSMVGKADPGIFATSASTAARIFYQPRRSATTNGDALRRRRSYPINEPD